MNSKENISRRNLIKTVASGAVAMAINKNVYSNNDKNTIIYKIENLVFLLTSLAQTQANPQKTANKLGKSIIAIGIKNT